MVKKRTSLDSLFAAATAADEVQTGKAAGKTESVSESVEKPRLKKPPEQVTEVQTAAISKPKSEIIKQTVYLPSAVHEQLRQLAFEERKKMHDYLVEGLDRVFKDRGLKSYVELSGETK